LATVQPPNPEAARIQTARGLACMMVVAYHVIGNTPQNGLRVEPDSLARSFSLSLELMQMPLFAYLAGFVYAYKPVTASTRSGFFHKKVLRLLVPLFVVGTLVFATQAVVPGVNAPVQWHEIWKIYVLPFQHLWFLQSIFLLFMLMMALRELLENTKGYLVTLALAFVAAHVVYLPVDVFSINGAIYLAPFFILGIGANRYRDSPAARRIREAAPIVALVLGAIYIWYCIARPLDAPERATLFALAFSTAFCIALMSVLRGTPLLVQIGKFSFAIYLYHVFFTAGSRIFLNRTLEAGIGLHFACGLLAGLIGPILLELVLRRWRATRGLMLGQQSGQLAT